MNYSVKFLPMDVTVSVPRGTTILDAAIQAGIEISSSCGGKGTCRKCRVIVEGDFEYNVTSKLDEKLEAKGYRLACQSHVAGDVKVFVPEEARVTGHQILETHKHIEVRELSPLTIEEKVTVPEPSLTDNLGDLERLARALCCPPDELRLPLPLLASLPAALRDANWRVKVLMTHPSVGNRVLAVKQWGGSTCLVGAALDIGTTSVVLSLVDLSSGKILATASDYNRQTRYGDDVITRIAYAEEGGLEDLRTAVLETINELLSEARSSASKLIGHCDVTGLSVAGNTTMIHMFLGLDPKHIRYEPYVPAANLIPIHTAGETGVHIHPEAPVYCLPCRAGFVGGDITADVVASGMHNENALSLLIDVGTNGEVVLGSDEFLMASSTSAGPAFEGGEVASGMRAMPGAIEKVRIDEKLKLTYTTIGRKPPLGICGSGLIDLMAQMFVRGLIDKKGRIQKRDDDRVRQTDEGLEFVVARAEGKEIVVRDGDLANLIRTKAAMYAGCTVLVRSVGKRLEDVEHVYIAGGFGNYIDIGNAIAIGLLPDLPEERFAFIGNGTLAGAVQTLLSAEKRREARKVYEDMTYVELSTDRTFFDEFSSASFLPHTDQTRFRNRER